MVRPSGRNRNELREVTFQRKYIKHAEGSCLVSFGETKVCCTVSISPGVPRFLKGSNSGWISAEYGMLPRSTAERMQREAKGGQTGRTQEIQRLIGRSLRTAVDLKALGENTIQIDCDVLQADGGTRTAGITGTCVALYDAFEAFKLQGILKVNPLRFFIASVSVGMYGGLPVLDLDYQEDSNSDTDMNVVMTEKGAFLEIQGTGEKRPFSEKELAGMLELAVQGIGHLIVLQKQVLGL